MNKKTENSIKRKKKDDNSWERSEKAGKKIDKMWKKIKQTRSILESEKDKSNETIQVSKKVEMTRKAMKRTH